MKTKKISTLLVAGLFTATLVACGSNTNPTPTPTPSKDAPIQTTTDSPKETTSVNPAQSSTGAPTPSASSSKSTSNSDDVTAELLAYKSTALAKLDEIVNPVIESIPNEYLKVSIQSFYDTEKAYIEGITDLDIAKEAANKVLADSKVFVNDTLKPLAIEKINAIINPLIDKITHEELKTSVQAFYNTEIAKIDDAETLDELKDTYIEIVDDTKKFIKDETEKIVVALKNAVLAELDPYVTALIEKIPYETLKTDLGDFYTEEKKKLEDVDAIEDVNPCKEEIIADLDEFALTEIKKTAVSKLEEIVTLGVAKLPNEDLKADLEEFSETEIKKINDTEKLEDVPTTLQTVLSETETHIKELLASTVKDYYKRLTKIETANAYDYLPEAMLPTYDANLVNQANINYDFSSFTNVSALSKSGYGEQWQMVIENINQSITMAKVFNLAQTTLNAAGNALDIYIANSYAEEMEHDFDKESFTAHFEFKDGMFIFNINLKDSVNVPGVGTVKPVIKMEYDLAKDAKGMFISLGDSYKVKYIVSEDFYEMATTYGVSIASHNGSRTSYLSISKEEGKTTGHIYEYTTLDGSDKIKACADFYIEDNYVSVVGNKASGMIGFDGYVNELYKADEGKLLGYEVREEKTVSGVKGTYNTLWFNLWDISGINNIKISDFNSKGSYDKRTIDVYLNNSTTLFEPTYNKKLGVRTSRKYDIELRSRFYYTYDEENNKYVANEVKVPMMFIQEDNSLDTNFTDYPEDMLKDNKITSAVTLNTEILNKILTDYDTLIDIFIVNKEKMSSEEIVNYLK